MSSVSDLSLLLVARTCQPIPAVLASQADALLLTQDALYQVNQADLSTLSASFKAIYALAPDAEARGLVLPQEVIAIDYNRWVELSLQAKQVIRI